MESKLIKLVNTFTVSDWKKYMIFSKSKYSNSSEMHTIMTFLKNTSNKKSLNRFSNNDIYKSINSTSSINGFANSTSTLANIVEKFILYEYLENDEYQKNKILSIAIAKRGLKSAFKKKKKERQKLTPKIGLWSKLDDMLINHHHYYNNMSDSISEGEIVLRAAIKDFLSFKSSISAYYEVEAVNRSLLTQENWEDQIKLLKLSQLIETESNPIFKDLIEIKLEKGKSAFNRLWEILKKNKKLYSDDIISTIYIHLISFSVYNIKTKNEGFSPTIQELYKWGFENDMYLSHNFIPKRRFFNIIDHMCHYDEEWTKDIIEKFAIKVSKKNVGEIKMVSNSLILFHKNRFQDLIDLLNIKKFKSFDMELKARMMLLISYFECNENNYDFVDSKINTFRYFIKKNQKYMSKNTYKGFYNLSKYILKLINGENPIDIRAAYSKEKYLISRNWLSNKLKSKIPDEKT